MTITREQLADLQPGDVVRLTLETTVAKVGKELRLGTGELLAWSNGDPATWTSTHTLTVVSRAPRPLYVNHPRTEPVAGDVARDDLGDKLALFICTNDGDGLWWLDTAADWNSAKDMEGKRLRLLVDGETGEVIP